MATKNVMACRPADLNDVPLAARPPFVEMERLTPSTGWEEHHCEICGIKVRMGPRQSAAYDLHPSTFMVLDFLCAIVEASKYPAEKRKVFGMGGR
jgi:hypothetical protein